LKKLDFSIISYSTSGFTGLYLLGIDEACAVATSSVSDIELHLCV